MKNGEKKSETNNRKKKKKEIKDIRVSLPQTNQYD